MRIVKHPNLRSLPPNTSFARYNPSTRQCTGLYATRAEGMIGIIPASALAPREGASTLDWVPYHKDRTLALPSGRLEVQVPFSEFEPTGFYAVFDESDPHVKNLMVYVPTATTLGLSAAPASSPSPLFPQSK